jgi:UDP-N-acetylmuramoyl-tripeptide--D-alanyl-D-alanine ligase
MDAALEMLVELTKEGRAIAVLGDMFELGDETAAAHRRLGRHAAKLKIDRLYLLGENAPLVAEGAEEEKLSAEAIRIMKSHHDIVYHLREKARRGDVILVKGSRGMRMERIVKGLKGEQV